MLKVEDNKLLLSVVNPDLNFYQNTESDQIDKNGDQIEVSVYSRQWLTNESQPVNSTITIKGIWTLSAPQNGVIIKHSNKNTLITTTTTQATPVVINLVK